MMYATIRKRDGQVMLLSVLAIGGIFLAATTVAGLLMVYQIRQASETNASTAAIMAADAGTEWALYRNTHRSETWLPFPVFTNEASVTVTCYKEGVTTPVPQKNDGGASQGGVGCSDAEVVRARSNGVHRNANRIFEITNLRSFVGSP
jgi:hypothetical protein